MQDADITNVTEYAPYTAAMAFAANGRAIVVLHSAAGGIQVVSNSSDNPGWKWSASLPVGACHDLQAGFVNNQVSLAWLDGVRVWGVIYDLSKEAFSDPVLYSGMTSGASVEDLVRASNPSGDSIAAWTEDGRRIAVKSEMGGKPSTSSYLESPDGNALQDPIAIMDERGNTCVCGLEENRRAIYGAINPDKAAFFGSKAPLSTLSIPDGKVVGMCATFTALAVPEGRLPKVDVSVGRSTPGGYVYSGEAGGEAGKDSLRVAFTYCAKSKSDPQKYTLNNWIFDTGGLVRPIASQTIQAKSDQAILLNSSEANTRAYWIDPSTERTLRTTQYNPVTYAFEEPEFVAGDATAILHATGSASGGDALVYLDEASGNARVLSRFSPTDPYTVYAAQFGPLTSAHASLDEQVLTVAGIKSDGGAVLAKIPVSSG